MPSKGWHSRGYLPHFDSQEIVQFVTYRLADSLPPHDRPCMHGGTDRRRRPRTIVRRPITFTFCLGVNEESTLSDIVGSWKKFTARRRSQYLGRSGSFWQADYWDRFIRNDAHFEAAISYIDNNSVTAGLAKAPADWAWGSARFKR
jgi:putative transposase